MAKETRQSSAKVRVFYAEVEGGDATIQDGLRTIGAALVRACQPHVPARTVKSLSVASGNGKPEEPTLFDPPVQPVDQDSDDGLEDVLDNAGASSEERATRQRRNRKLPTYSFVKDLDLHPQDKPSLCEFFAEKAPDGQQEQFVVILFYLTKVLDLSNIGADHIYTSLKEVKQRIPNDILQVARNTSNRKGWIDASDGSNLRVTVPGENFVAHALPPNSPVTE